MTEMSKTILITGATDGIGKATALELAARGDHIIIHGRNHAKTAAVRAAIQDLTKNTNIDIIIADLLSFIGGLEEQGF